MNIESSIDEIIDEIERLCNIPSPTGYTIEVSKYVEERLKDLGYDPKISNKGSVLCNIGGTHIGDRLLLSAHIDTLGLMVRALKDNGRLRFTKIGGFPENNIETENCTVITRDNRRYSGTVQMINPATHVNAELRSEKRNDETMEIVLDEKVFSKDDLTKLGISSGDFVSLDPRTVVTQSGFIKSRHLDDKASAAILLGIAKYVKEKQIALTKNTYLLFTTYEEVGHGAASFLPENLHDFISVDMGAVGDDLETDEFKVSICAKDSHGPYDYELTTRLIETAKENNLQFAVDIYPYYGSDAAAALGAGYDVRHALIGPGVSASHGYERTHREGLENTFILLVSYLQK